MLLTSSHNANETMESRHNSTIHALGEVSENDPHAEGVRGTDQEVHEGEGSDGRGACPQGLCDGSGELATDELDPDSMQYMRGVGSQKCLCKLNGELS